MITPTPARFLDCDDAKACADAGFDPVAAGEQRRVLTAEELAAIGLFPLKSQEQISREDGTAGARAAGWFVAALMIAAVGAVALWMGVW